MTVALGGQVPLAYTVYNAAGTAVTPATATLTITQPDGATVVLTLAGGGLVSQGDLSLLALFTPTQVGWHQWVGVSTTPLTSTLPDSFTVIGGGTADTLAPLVSLAEVRNHLGVGTTVTDRQLQSFALAATEICESGKGTNRIWRRQTITEVFTGNGQLSVNLARLKPLSITSITENGTTLTAGTDYVIDLNAGIVTRGNLLGYGLPWVFGTNNIVVTYVAGVNGAIPEAVRLGVLELVKHLWDTQRGGSNLPRQANDGSWDPRMGYTVPRRVKEIWGPFREIG